MRKTGAEAAGPDVVTAGMNGNYFSVLMEGDLQPAVALGAGKYTDIVADKMRVRHFCAWGTVIRTQVHIPAKLRR